MAIAIALPGFNDPGRSVTPTFFPETDFIYNYLHIVQKWTKYQCGKLENFCPRDIESCHLAAARRVKLWSLNAILFFMNLTSWLNSLNSTLKKNIGLRTFYFKDQTKIFWGLQTLWPYSQTKPDFFLDLGCSSGHFSPKRSRWPPFFFFFYISNMTNSSSYSGKSLRKKSMLENFRANVLKLIADFSCSLRHITVLRVIKLQTRCCREGEDAKAGIVQQKVYLYEPITEK